MITNTGKSIIGKFLIGQAPAYASYIAVGCGAKPLSNTYDLSSTDPEVVAFVDGLRTKQSLDFEMFRIPITSRGYVNDNGINKVVFTAELPTEERYEISEVGLYSAGSNPSVGNNDSRTILAFDDAREWTYGSNASAIPMISTPLDAGDTGADDQHNNRITVTYPVFKTNADNRVFTDIDRVARYERCRFLNKMIMLRGDSSDLSVSQTNHLSLTSGSGIMLTGFPVNFTQNSPLDSLKLAFSVINRLPDPEYVPDEVRILVEFSSSAVLGSGEFARFEVILTEDLSSNRYFIASKQLQELVKSTSGFTWSSVDTIKIYACVIKDDVVSPDYYVALDAMRLENSDTSNPLYGMTGYTVIKNSGSKTIVKSANKTSYVEFRFGMDILWHYQIII